MTFEHLREQNEKRCNGFLHPIDGWSPSEWSNAMAGECGEACNITKKMRRLEDITMKGQMNKETDQDLQVLIEELTEEVADVVIYADLLLARMQISLSDAIKNKFNKTSETYEDRNKLPFETLPRL